MRINDASPGDIAAVAMAMREADYRELSALSVTDNREDLAKVLVTRFSEPGVAIVASLDQPVAIGAVIMARPNVGTLLFFATDEFPRIAVGMTRWITKELFPRYRKAGVHRIECVSQVDYTAAHAWIRTLGLTRDEGVFEKYGKGGEAYRQLSWLADDEDILG